MAASCKSYRFTATLYKVGINRCVDVPERISKALGERRYVPVVATVKGCSVRTTLVPRGRGRYRLFVNGEVRKAAGVDAGDKVSVALRFDRESREIPVPKDVAKGLSDTIGARAAFETLTPIQRTGFLQSVLNAKKPETRQRRIKTGIERLLQMAARKSHRRRSS